MRRISYLMVLAMVLMSCNQDDNSTSQMQQEAEDSFFALKVGNNWTYSYFSRNQQTGDLTNLNIQLQLEVTQENIINGETYYTLTSTTTGNEGECAVCDENGVGLRQVRDSLGYLIDVDGQILFSSEGTAEYLQSTNEWGDVYRFLKPETTEVEVPAGKFTCLDNERIAYKPDGELYFGRDNLYFAPKIGEVKETYVGVTTGQIFFEKHLMSYSID